MALDQKMILYKAQAQDSQQLRRQLPLDFLTLTQTEFKSSFKMDNLSYEEVQHEAFEAFEHSQQPWKLPL